MDVLSHSNDFCFLRLLRMFRYCVLLLLCMYLGSWMQVLYDAYHKYVLCHKIRSFKCYVIFLPSQLSTTFLKRRITLFISVSHVFSKKFRIFDIWPIFRAVLCEFAQVERETCPRPCYNLSEALESRSLAFVQHFQSLYHTVCLQCMW